ncbi:MAG TPA: Stp1/IreP family PP2C-type Ser/Thr phosphatase, partial [Chloroflexota bacterium]|nr:Stp1/IreP family PP2C-type Ser/Thr phosphatase [Chloroflexota bacterium]
MKKTSVDAAALSDRGQVRESNEDSVFLESPVSPSAHARGLLVIVADGMGGHAAGEIASHIAAQSVRARYYQSPNPYIVESLQESMEAANAEVWQESRRQAGRAGMGCTLTTAVIHDNHLVVGHVGDSRAYLVRGDSIVQITEDHSLVAEQVTEGELSPEAAKEHPQRNVITRAIGEKASVKIDIYEEELQGGDVVVLCTDGLTAVVSDEDIGQLVVNSSAKRAAEALV